MSGSWSRRLAVVGLEIWLPILVVAAWWVWSAGADSAFFPPLSDILHRFRELWLFAQFTSDVLPSLRNLAIGFAISAAAGIAVGLLVGRIGWLRSLTEPVVTFMRSTPAVAIVPIFVLVLGFGSSMKISIIAVAAFFPTLIATVDGVRSVDPVLMESVRVYQLSTRQRIFQVLLPSAGPQIFAGLQVSLQTAFVVMIASEMLGSSEGIGALTLKAQQSFQVQDMWAGIVLLGVLGYLINLLFLLVRRHWLGWYDGVRKAAKQ
jgi:ABC-type nitrate/sulfonate/bicarbonate transport system permease component